MDIKPHLKSLSLNIFSVALAVCIGIPLGKYIQEKLMQPNYVQTLTPIPYNDASNLFKDKTNDLILYADTKCIYCKEGIALLNKKESNYKVYFIDQDKGARKEYQKLNTGGVPVLVSRNQYISGFNEESWERFILSSRAN